MKESNLPGGLPRWAEQVALLAITISVLAIILESVQSLEQEFAPLFTAGMARLPDYVPTDGLLLYAPVEKSGLDLSDSLNHGTLGRSRTSRCSMIKAQGPFGAWSWTPSSSPSATLKPFKAGSDVFQ